jgi:hypothetical protein
MGKVQSGYLVQRKDVDSTLAPQDRVNKAVPELTYLTLHASVKAQANSPQVPSGRLWLVKTKRRPSFFAENLAFYEWKGAPRGKSSITRSSWKGVEELDSTGQKWISPLERTGALLPSVCRGVLEKCLTPPTLSEMSERRFHNEGQRLSPGALSYTNAPQ